MNRRAYSCEASAPRLKKTEWVAPSSLSVRTRTLTPSSSTGAPGVPPTGYAA